MNSTVGVEYRALTFLTRLSLCLMKCHKMKTRTVLKHNAVKTHCDKGKGKVVPVLFFY